MECFLLLLLVSFTALLSATSDQINIKAVIGENKVLPCRAENRPIRVVEWKRTDIKEENVLRYRGQVDRGDQHPSFKNRVIFQDREMKDGDVSLVLINVTMNDAGTYEAKIVYDGTNREKKLCSIHLHVAPPPPSPPPPPPPGSVPSWAIALLVIAAVLVLILSGFLLYRRIPRWLHSKFELKEEKNKKTIDEIFSSQVPQVEEGKESVLLPEELHEGRDGDNRKHNHLPISMMTAHCSSQHDKGNQNKVETLHSSSSSSTRLS